VWQTNTTVGSRPVLASGTLVIAHGEDSASIYANGLQYLFNFIPGENPATAELFPISATAVGIRFSGDVGMGCAWQWSNFGLWQGNILTLAVELRHAPPEQDARPHVFILGYTFALGPSPLSAIGGGQ
jgi:hypothetical protein